MALEPLGGMNRRSYVVRVASDIEYDAKVIADLDGGWVRHVVREIPSSFCSVLDLGQCVDLTGALAYS